jgi:hypothetical protein
VVTIVACAAGYIIGVVSTAVIYETLDRPLLYRCPYCGAPPCHFCTADDGKRLIGCVHIERTRP